MRKRLCDVIKCNAAPKVLADQFDERRKTLKTIVSSQGDAGKNFVIFLDNHDLNERFHQQNWPKQSRPSTWKLLFSTADPGAGDSLPISPSATRAFGSTHACVVTLQPMEGQVLRRS